MQLSPSSDSLSLRLRTSQFLTSLHNVTRRSVLQKVHDRGLIPLSLLVNTGFQVLFHSPPGVLFTFPSRFIALSVTDRLGTGISTSCPSPTTFVLGLGPDLPWADEPSPGNLGLSTCRFLACISLLIPAFSLLCRPRRLSIPLQPAHYAPLPLALRRTRSFGGVF